MKTAWHSWFGRTNFITLVLACAAIVRAQGPASLRCAIEGDTRTASVQALNRLKNRLTVPRAEDIDTAVSTAAMVASGQDRRRFNTRKAAHIVGLVADVKVGGVESVNCHARSAADRDTHIELLVGSADPDPSRRVILEVTPRWRALMAQKGVDWSTDALRRRLVGRWIEVTGWLLYDGEHEAESANTHRGNGEVWRATAWEVHPVTAMSIAPAPRGARGR